MVWGWIHQRSWFSSSTVGCLVQPCGSQGYETLLFGLGNKCLYPLSHLADLGPFIVLDVDINIDVLQVNVTCFVPYQLLAVCLSLFSVAVIKLEEERVYFAYTPGSQSVTEGSQGRKLEAGTEVEAMEDAAH